MITAPSASPHRAASYELPCDLEAERAVLASIALVGGEDAPNAALVLTLPHLAAAGAFYVEAHGAWYQAALDVERAGGRANVESIYDELQRQHALGAPFAAHA